MSVEFCIRKLMNRRPEINSTRIIVLFEEPVFEVKNF